MLTSTYDASLIDYAYPTCINMLSNMTHKYALKSGSTDTDAWVIGYTNGIVLASWSGYDDNKKLTLMLLEEIKIMDKCNGRLLKR